jgi:hypothetical protein
MAPKDYWHWITFWREIKNFPPELGLGLGVDIPAPDGPPFNPLDPVGPLARIDVLEQIVFDMFEVVALNGPALQSAELSKGNLFRSIGGTDEQEAALKKNLERLAKATAVVEERLSDLG